MIASALRRRAHLALPPRRAFFAWSGQVTDLKDKLQDIERSQSERAQSMMELLEAQKQEAAREAQQQPLALLIDADNTSWRSIGPIMDEVATFGVASARRIYGDWTSQRLAPSTPWRMARSSARRLTRATSPKSQTKTCSSSQSWVLPQCCSSPRPRTRTCNGRALQFCEAL